MVSVERTLEYSHLEPEQAEIVPQKSHHGQIAPDKTYADVPQLPPSDWPSSGAFEFRDVTMRYSEDTPAALRNVSFIVEAREKVDLCCGPVPTGMTRLLGRLVS